MKISEFIKWYRDNVAEIKFPNWELQNEFAEKSLNIIHDIVSALEEAKELISYSHGIGCNPIKCADWERRYFPKD